MAHKPDDKRDDKDDKKVDTKSEVKAGAASDQRAGQVGATGDKFERGVPPRGGTREGEPATPTARPTINSPTSDQLQFVVETHVTVFSPDELSVLNAAVVELKDYEVLTAPPPPPVVRDVPYVQQEGPNLTCTMGNWEGEPTQYTYDWHRDGTFVVGGAASTYAVLIADVGTTFTCVVTASNGSGATQAPPSNGVVVTDPTGARAAKDPLSPLVPPGDNNHDLRVHGRGFSLRLDPQFLTLVIINVLILGALFWFTDSRARHTAVLLDKLMASCPQLRSAQ